MRIKTNNMYKNLKFFFNFEIFLILIDKGRNKKIKLE